MHSANDRGPYREFPWALFLPPDEVPLFLADMAAAGERGLEALEQTVTEWRHTAEIHAEPWLARRLSEPVTGDHGTVLPPDQFDALMADDAPDPAPKLAEVAQRARRFVRKDDGQPLPTPTRVHVEFGVRLDRGFRAGTHPTQGGFSTRDLAAEWGDWRINRNGVTGYRIVCRERHFFARESQYAMAVTRWVEDTETITADPPA